MILSNTNMPGVYVWSCDCTICIMIDVRPMDPTSVAAIGTPCEQCGAIVRVMHSPAGPSMIVTAEHGFVPGATAIRGHAYDPDRCPREVAEVGKRRNAPLN